MIGHLIYNYEHLDDCRAQQEISKHLYARAFGGVHLVQTYNGKKSFGYRRYLEDKLIVLKNRGHWQGAADLINAGLNYFTANKIHGLRYVLVTAADTWALNIRFLKRVTHEMEIGKQGLAASSWGSVKYPDWPHGLSTDFFIIDIAWNRKTHLFPVDYLAFKKQYSDFFYLQWKQPIFEYAVQLQYIKYLAAHYEDNQMRIESFKQFRRLVEREPIHRQGIGRIENWAKIGLYTAPRPEAKRRVLRQLGLDVGPHTHRLMTAKSLAYYNRHS